MVAIRQFRHPQFDRWLATLPVVVAAEIAACIDYLCDHGRGAVLPDVRHRIQTSRHYPDMSEIRTDQIVDDRRYLMRVLTCFADADTTRGRLPGRQQGPPRGPYRPGLVRRPRTPSPISSWTTTATEEPSSD